MREGDEKEMKGKGRGGGWERKRTTYSTLPYHLAQAPNP